MHVNIMYIAIYVENRCLMAAEPAAHGSRKPYERFLARDCCSKLYMRVPARLSLKASW